MIFPVGHGLAHGPIVIPAARDDPPSDRQNHGLRLYQAGTTGVVFDGREDEDIRLLLTLTSHSHTVNVSS